MEMRNMVVETEGKAVSMDKVAGHLAKLCSTILWEVQLVSVKIGYLIEQISKQTVEVMVQFLLAVHGKI